MHIAFRISWPTYFSLFIKTLHAFMSVYTPNSLISDKAILKIWLSISDIFFFPKLLWEVFDFWLDLYHRCQKSLFYTRNCCLHQSLFHCWKTAMLQNSLTQQRKQLLLGEKSQTACFSAVAWTALKQCLFDVEKNTSLVIPEPLFSRQCTPISFTIISIVLPWALLLFSEEVCPLQLLSCWFLFILICRFRQVMRMVSLL